MRWGQRGTVNNAPASPGTRNYNTKSMSNKDLSNVVKRMELEQRYTDLNKKGKAIHKGQSATKKFLSKNGDKVAGIVISGAATAAVAAFLKSPKAAKYLNKISNIGP